MSRSNYQDGFEMERWDLIRWRGAVKSAIRGERGQKCLRDMLASIDSMPTKQLIKGELESAEGVCAIGCLGRARGVDMSIMDPEDADRLSKAFGIAPALAREIMFENDECGWRESPEQTWARMRKWVAEQLTKSEK